MSGESISSAVEDAACPKSAGDASGSTGIRVGQSPTTRSMPHSNRWKRDFDPAGGGPIGSASSSRTRPRSNAGPRRSGRDEADPRGLHPRRRPDPHPLFRRRPHRPGFAELAPRSRRPATPEYPLEERYRLEPFAGSTTGGPDDVLALWKREGAVPEPERSGGYTKFIWSRSTRTEGVVGVSSSYLQRNHSCARSLYYRIRRPRPPQEQPSAVCWRSAAARCSTILFVSGRRDPRRRDRLRGREPGAESNTSTGALACDRLHLHRRERARRPRRVHYFPGAVLSAPL